MSKVNPVEIAIEMALNSHFGQTDKNGQPYILHCLRVMLQGKNADEQIVGVLHDAVEDTSLTVKYLHHRLSGVIFDQFRVNMLVDAILAITKSKSETVVEYAHRVRVDPLAREVKMSDISDNTDPKRMGQLPLAVQARLKEKYDTTWQIVAHGEKY